jgi:hypothetical protein
VHIGCVDLRKGSELGSTRLPAIDRPVHVATKDRPFSRKILPVFTRLSSAQDRGYNDATQQDSFERNAS